MEAFGLRLESARMTDHYQALMNHGQRDSGFIEGYTGEFVCDLIEQRLFGGGSSAHPS